MAKKIKQRHPPLFCFLYGSDCSVSTPPQAVMNCFFHNPPTAARFPNPSRRGLQACFAHSQIPCVKGAPPKAVRDCFLQPFHHFVVPLPLHRGGKVRTPLGDACKHAPHTCKSLYTKEPKTRHHFNLLAPQAHRFSSFFYLRFYLRVADVALAKRQKLS